MTMAVREKTPRPPPPVPAKMVPMRRAPVTTAPGKHARPSTEVIGRWPTLATSGHTAGIRSLREVRAAAPRTPAGRITSGRNDGRTGRRRNAADRPAWTMHVITATIVARRLRRGAIASMESDRTRTVTVPIGSMPTDGRRTVSDLPTTARRTADHRPVTTRPVILPFPRCVTTALLRPTPLRTAAIEIGMTPIATMARHPATSAVDRRTTMGTTGGVTTAGRMATVAMLTDATHITTAPTSGCRTADPPASDREIGGRLLRRGTLTKGTRIATINPFRRATATATNVRS